MSQARSAAAKSTPVEGQIDFCPRAKRGSISFMKNDLFHTYGGYVPSDWLTLLLGIAPTRLETLDLNTGRWSSSETTPVEQLPESISGSCAVFVNNKLYHFGGFLGGSRNASIHELDIDSLKWQKVKIKNPEIGPIHKDKARMFTYGNTMIGLVGGYGYPDDFEHKKIIDSQPALYSQDPANDLFWTSELHLFHLEQMEWLVPEVSGVPPKPCAAFSLTRVDPYRLVLFGGKRQEERINEVHILNLDTWHWSGVNIPSSPHELWPVGRSFHSAVSLCDPMAIAPPSPSSAKQHDWLPWPAPELFPSEPCVRVDPKILVVGGLTTDCEPLRDLWELNVNTLTWKLLKVPKEFVARLWHTSAAYYPSPCEAAVVIHGGTSENIFGKPGHLCPNISRSCILHFGLESLAKICVDLILKDKALLASSYKLPVHIQDELKKQSINSSQLSVHVIARL